MEGRAGTARSGSTSFSGCRNDFRRMQSPVPLWKRPQTQEVLGLVIAFFLAIGRGKRLPDGLCLS
jgi:hypothetical protein